MKPGLTALTDSFQARQPELVQQVKTMMAELERISVLSIEQWHITLLDLQVKSSAVNDVPHFQDIAFQE